MCVAALGGCTLLEPGGAELRHAAVADAERAGFIWALRSGDGFDIATAARLEPGARRIHVYVEGDGHAWSSRRRVSADPTPRAPVALHLALKDPHPSVVYIARPCQYLDAAQLARCAPRYWTSHRYAPEVIEALGKVIDAALGAGSRGSAAPARLVLIGYSGGGTIASLLALARSDADALMTVAANLDHGAWSRFHDVSPLDGSAHLPPERLAAAGLTQLHLLGSQDDIVPPQLAQRFLLAVSRHAGGAGIEWRIIEQFDHRCCWQALWPEPLAWLYARLGTAAATSTRSVATQRP